MLALLVLGALTAHVKRGWKAAQNRLSGVLVLALNAFLIATGYGLYYAADEDFRAWLIRWHGWIGLGTLVLLPAHVVVGRIIIAACTTGRCTSDCSLTTEARHFNCTRLRSAHSTVATASNSRK